jgi:uncharacterized protein (TIGR03435 family)
MDDEHVLNIQARSDEAADAKLAKLTDNEVRLEKRNAIRALLAERLGLKTHLEDRNSSIYNLVVGKGGDNMQVLPTPRDGEAVAILAGRSMRACWHGISRKQLCFPEMPAAMEYSA